MARLPSRSVARSTLLGRASRRAYGPPRAESIGQTPRPTIFRPASAASMLRARTLAPCGGTVSESAVPPTTVSAAPDPLGRLRPRPAELAAVRLVEQAVTRAL